jgi:hypothetical protein
VQFVEVHNFHVGWNLKFEVEMDEISWSTLAGTIHRCQENFASWPAVRAKSVAPNPIEPL